VCEDACLCVHRCVCVSIKIYHLTPSTTHPLASTRCPHDQPPTPARTHSPPPPSLPSFKQAVEGVNLRLKKLGEISNHIGRNLVPQADADFIGLVSPPVCVCVCVCVCRAPVRAHSRTMDAASPCVYVPPRLPCTRTASLPQNTHPSPCRLTPPPPLSLQQVGGIVQHEDLQYLHILRPFNEQEVRVWCVFVCMCVLFVHVCLCVRHACGPRWRHSASHLIHHNPSNERLQSF
jgi:hypothetical protein